MDVSRIACRFTQLKTLSDALRNTGMKTSRTAVSGADRWEAGAQSLAMGPNVSYNRKNYGQRTHDE